MTRLLCIAMVLVAVLPNASAQDSVKPMPILASRVKTTAAESSLALACASITKQNEIDFDLSAVDGSMKVAPIPRTDFWLAAEALAQQTGTRLSLVGGKVRFTKGPAALCSVDGPFRVSVKQITAKRDFDTVGSVYDVLLEVIWEPRFPVYMIDNIPKVDLAKTGNELFKAGATTGRVPTTGFRQLATVRLSGIPRSAASIDVLRGSFNVIAAEKLLALEFKDLTSGKPITLSSDGVKVTLAPVQKLTSRVQFDVNLEYPASHPEFESFELWTGSNRLRLYPPSNEKGYEPIDTSTNENGRKIAVSYAFDTPAGKPTPFADLKGWKAIYETPSPMVTQAVKFELKGIALP